jgi:hypothetical protein
LLSKLGIKPIKAGLVVDVVYWDGLLLSGKDLRIDLDEYLNQIRSAYTQSLNVAIKAEYPASKQVTEILLKQAFIGAISVAKESNYLTKESADMILGSAEANAQKLLQLAKQKGYTA